MIKRKRKVTKSEKINYYLQSKFLLTNNIYQFNKLAHHNSHNWYIAVIEWYIDKWGGMPSEVGPASHVELILDD